MTSQEIQRTMEFILRSQADAVIRMERREEEMERRMERWEKQSDKQKQERAETRADLREAGKIIRETARMARNHEKRMRSLEKSKRQSARRFEGMRDLARILIRLQAHQGRRFDRLEKK